jgi:hypothetical protein
VKLKVFWASSNNSSVGPLILGSSVHHVSVFGSVANIHNSDKIDIKNHSFIANGETYYMVRVYVA